MQPSNSFSDWQADYAAHGVATFPVGADKKPLVRRYNKFGLVGSAKIASRFADAPAIGFMCGKRSGVTVLDVDTTDERILADAVDRHGRTPVIVRSGSGHFQAWYRHAGERRLIRPRRDVPIDILGAGLLVAPPSRTAKGQYQFIQGSLDDLDSLPTLHDAPSHSVMLSSQIVTPAWGSMRDGDGRNGALFRLLGRAAHHCDDYDQLLDCAQTKNAEFGEPMEPTEVVKVAQSVWKMQCEGRNRFGQYGAYVPLNLVRKLAKSNPDALALYNVLKAENGPDSTFFVANGLANERVAMGRYRLVQARKALLDEQLIHQVSRASQRHPALYRWSKPDEAKGDI